MASSKGRRLRSSTISRQRRKRRPAQPWSKERGEPRTHEYQLRIDTTSDRGQVALIDKRGRVIAHQTFPLDPPSPGALLRAFDVLRRTPAASRQSRRFGRDPDTESSGPQAISGIDVIPGPGRFSRVRLGVVTANALVATLDIPLTVRGRRVRVAVPEYGAEPSISLKREAASRKLPEPFGQGVPGL